MLELKVIGSGSSGNAYVLRCNDRSLIIECGAGNVRDYVRLGMEDPEDPCAACISGVLITHKHGDHLNPKNLKDIYNMLGCPIYSNGDVVEIYKPNVCLAVPKRKFVIGPFKIMALNVMHGDVECYAYVIDTPEGRLVFATDLVNFPYNIKGCNYLCIECNYSQEIRNAKIADNEDVFSQSENHMELNTCEACVERHISPDLTHVVLLHLSNGLSDKNAFIGRIRQCCENNNYPFINVSVADKGENIELYNIPF